MAHELVDAFSALLLKAPPVAIALVIDGGVDIDAGFYNYERIDKAAQAAKGKCKCPCKKIEYET